MPLRMSVDAVSFSAHADFPQTAQFVEALAPRHVVLVHGEVNEMLRLRRALEQQVSWPSGCAGRTGRPACIVPHMSQAR